ncbi:hypothetical protein [Flavonifractor plautii]|mgnify:CR=1 FL=1|uniref:hypothetical protein n=1 Tax=Flavonifractor plautii TaxID=292800 RepID=UPI0036F1A2AF
MALFSYPVCTWLCQYVNMGVRKWLEKSAEKQKYKMRKTANPLSRKAFRAVSFSATKDTSEQALYRLLRLFYKSQSALTPLLILSKSQPLRWVVIWYRRFAAFFNFIEISVLTVLCRNPLKRNGFKGFLF